MNKEVRALVQRAQEGNAEAFERLVHQYDRRVLTLAYQLVGNTQDAEDVYQEAFMRAYDKIGKFRFESDFYTWLYRIVVNCAISYRKKRNRQLHRSIDAPAPNDDVVKWMPVDENPEPDKLILDREIREKIEATLESLSLMQRTVFVLRFFQDFKIKDIAQIIDCSEGTVKNYLFRGTQKMKKSLRAFANA